MSEPRTNRRLAAILAADVVGYSRMMASDEAGTLAALKRHRELVFDPAVAEHGGRIVKLMGDGTLVEFGSVVDAVKCALMVQRFPLEPDAGQPIVLRIGINLGDIILEGEDIYGDGVNIAARLEPLAEPGGICIASIVNESVGNRIDTTFRDGGEVSVKNIDRPIRIWKWSAGANSPIVRPPVPASQRPDQPSIAVLAFTNMSNDPEQEYFSDGITEDIITDLSKVGGLLVIARNSSFGYKGKNIDIRTIAQELRVRSVLEGSIRRVGSHVRITAQLIDVETGGHLWAERYDRDLTDIFAVQDEVTQQIVAALKVALTPSEEALIAGGGTKDLQAYDLTMRANALLVGSTLNLQIFNRMRDLFGQAIDRDSAYALPYALLGIAHVLDYLNHWTEDPDRSLAEAQRLADEALEKDLNYSVGHYAAGMAARHSKNFEKWKTEIEATLALNPNNSYACGDLGMMRIYAGDPEAAIPLLERAMRLDPAFNHQNLHFLGTAYLIAGKYETAELLFKERILSVPGTDFSRAFLAAALGHLGRADEARRLWAELMTINPKYSFEEHVGRLPFQYLADVDRIREGLTKAHLPPPA